MSRVVRLSRLESSAKRKTFGVHISEILSSTEINSYKLARTWNLNLLRRLHTAILEQVRCGGHDVGLHSDEYVTELITATCGATRPLVDRCNGGRWKVCCTVLLPKDVPLSPRTVLSSEKQTLR